MGCYLIVTAFDNIMDKKEIDKTTILTITVGGLILWPALLVGLAVGYYSIIVILTKSSIVLSGLPQ